MISTKVISIVLCSFLYSLHTHAQILKPYEPVCGENEKYTWCTSSTCFEESCGDLITINPKNRRCSRDCKSGCQCKPGYYRNQDGRCVDEVTCRMCGYNEDWVTAEETKELVEEATCETIFENRNRTLELSEESNSTKLSSGCRCIKGLFRTDDGLCVSEQSCIRCGTNEIFEGCGSHCELWEYSCKHTKLSLRERFETINKSKMQFCIQSCKSGCKCHPGFYRHNRTNECIPSSECCNRSDDGMDLS